MATIRYDGQSLIVDERRIWIVSAALHYPRIPHELWRDRIRAAKQAGCNAIETYVFWNFHEMAPGKFDFTGDRDLRAFVQAIADEQMYCILRPGPYVCAEWDAGGHPAWLWRLELGTNDVLKFREFNGPYLQAAERYLAAVMGQVADLQITRGGPTPGPIILTQVENEWMSGNDAGARPYFEALMRDLRTNGCETPIVACNNLWFRVDGAIDTWNASRHLPESLRQLAIVQPRAPRIVTEYWTGWFDHWGAEHASMVSPDKNLFRMASLLASGGQPSLYMFHGGTNFAFTGGRTTGDEPRYMTTSYDYDAPLSETGGRTPKYAASKRLLTFASQFGHVFAHLDPQQHHAAVLPDEEDPNHPPAVIQQTGSQGDVIFILKSEKDRSESIHLLLPNGMHLPVPTGRSRAAWVLFNASLSGVATLDLTNLCPFAWIDQRMLVLFGPAGSDAVVSVDGALYQFKVPAGDAPHVETHEGITLVALNDKQIDAAYPLADALVVGAERLDADDQPVLAKGFKQITTVRSDGTVETSRPKPLARPTAPRVGKWTYAPAVEVASPDDAGFTPIPGPRTLEQLACDFGYGWYRLGKMPAAANLARLATPNPGCGDRLHFFQEGKLVASHGLGPGVTQEPFKLQGKHDAVVLADNCGRLNYGAHLLEDVKGLGDHLYTLKAARVARPKIDRQRFPDLAPLQACVTEFRLYDRPVSDALTWKVRLTVKAPVMLELPLHIGCMTALVVNGQLIRLHNGDGSRGAVRYVLDARQKPFESGENTVTLHLHNPDLPAKPFVSQINFYQATPATEKCDWQFKPFALPDDGAFRDMPARTPATPAFYRTTFNVRSTAAPLCAELHGVSKGQLYLNEHNVGRYFVQTATGKAVPPQLRYYLPEPWLRTDAPNVLTLFDEHGKTPDKIKLTYV